MTQTEKTKLKENINKIKAECDNLEELYLSTKHIQYRWSKQRLEKIIEELKTLL